MDSHVLSDIPTISKSGLSTTDTPARSMTAERALEGKEQFLKLLVAQISNQNPLDPVNDKDMVSQLAQFSAIEQAIETNTRLGSLEASQNNAARLNLSGLIGKEATAHTGNVMISGDGSMPQPLAFTLDTPAAEVTLRLIDHEGKLARTIDLGNTSAGAHSIDWDGRAETNRALLAGNYRMQVRAKDVTGAEISARSEIYGKIRRVDMADGNPAVYLGDVRVPVSQVSALHE